MTSAAPPAAGRHAHHPRTALASTPPTGFFPLLQTCVFSTPMSQTFRFHHPFHLLLFRVLLISLQTHNRSRHLVSRANRNPAARCPVFLGKLSHKAPSGTHPGVLASDFLYLVKAQDRSPKSRENDLATDKGVHVSFTKRVLKTLAN